MTINWNGKLVTTCGDIVESVGLEDNSVKILYGKPHRYELTYFVDIESGKPISTMVNSALTVRNVKTNRDRAIDVVTRAMSYAVAMNASGIVAALAHSDLIKED